MRLGVRVVLPLAVLAAITVLALAQLNQKTNHENDVQQRGQTPVQAPGQSPDTGRIGEQAPVPNAPVRLHGLLLDASCPNRSNPNLYAMPESVPLTMPSAGVVQQRSAGASSARGITVNTATVDTERADIMAHQVPDMRSRQASETCAITASTREYGLALPNGRFVDLDAGGNTLANELVYDTPQGQQMLNGIGPAVKLRVDVVGRVVGDKVIVEELTR